MSDFLLDGKVPSDLSWDVIGGQGFFGGVRAMTTLLTVQSRLVDFDRHFARLAKHIEYLQIGEAPRAALLRFEVEQLIQRLGFPKMARVRVVVFKDDAGVVRRLISANVEDSDALHIIQDRGLRLHPVRDSSWERGSHVKTGIIGSRGVELARAKSGGFDDVLWLNSDGELTEATWANIFMIGRTGDLVEIATPPSASGLLEGVTRQRITELLGSAQIPVTERVITEEEIPGFDEAFVTSSIRGLIPITQIGQHRLHTLRPQSVFRHIARLYQTWLKVDELNNSGALDLN